MILMVQAFKKGCSFADYAGYVVGQLLKNNNWRWCALVLLSVVCTISAILAGFGRPILISSAREAKANLVESIGATNVAVGKGFLSRLMWGTNSSPASASAVSSTTSTTTGKKYASWWHWRIAFLLWFVTFCYTFFAFWDEAKAAFSNVLKSLERKQRQIRNNPAVVTIAPAAPASKLPSFFGGHFWKLLNIEIVGGWVSEFLKLVGIKLFKK
jgi:hypothetical protein